MSTSTVTFTQNPFPKGRDSGLTHTRIMGTIAIGAGDYPANGLPIAWTRIDPPIGVAPIVPARIEGLAGFTYRHDTTHGTIRIFVTGTAANDPLNEVSTTTPSGVVSDTITAEALFNKAE